MKILITGFDPFGGEEINPAWEAVKRMKDNILGAEIVKMQIPTVFKKSVEMIHQKMKEIHPDVVLSIGQAGGRNHVQPERVAINIMDGRIADNEGFQPIDEPNFADGDVAYFSSLPVKAITEKIQSAGFPATVSNTAGTYVCNHVMYGVLYYISREFPDTKGGFIHVPFIPEQVVSKPNYAAMSLQDIVTCLEKAVEAIVENPEDVKICGGTIH